MSDLKKINFSEIPLLKGLSGLDLARLIPNFELLNFSAGEVLFRKGDRAESLFIIIEGDVTVYLSDEEGSTRELARVGPHEIIGEMALLSGELRSANVRALSDLVVLRLRKERFDRLVKKHSTFSLHLNSLLAKKVSSFNTMNVQERRDLPSVYTGPSDPSDLQDSEAGSWASQKHWSRPLGWFISLLAPALIVFSGPWLGLEKDPSYFLAIFTSMVIMWIFGLVDDYVPGLLALFATVAMGLAPPSLVLSGFSSDGFLMAMSFLGLGSVIYASGLGYRLLLNLMLHLPNSQFWHSAGLLLTGFFLTPLIPSANGRISLLAPLAMDMAELLHLRPRGPAATRFIVAAFSGATLLSGVFLSSKSVNFIVLGMLPLQVQERFQWMQWLLASAVTGLAVIIMYLVFVSFMFFNREAPKISKAHLSAQIHLMGKITLNEWGSICAIFIFIAGTVTASYHKIRPSWLGLAILCGLLLLGSLSRKGFREKIDWPFLVYVAEMGGLIGVFNYLGLDQWVAAGLSGLGLDHYMRSHFMSFIALLCCVIFIIRLAVPISAAIIMVSALFLPLAVKAGINPWLMGFIILVLGEMWVFPYQCSYYIQLREMAKDRGMCDEASFLKFNMMMNVMKICGIYASVPYWKMTGLL